jgi:hypothetical protein
MRLVGGPQNSVYLRDILQNAIEGCTRVRAAVAYASRDNMQLFDACRDAKCQLEFYGRYDATVAVDPQILKWFIEQSNANLTCRLVPDILHGKVIWWENSGVYIGSANLSARAWISNIEYGIYLDQDEIVEQGLELQLAEFFDLVEAQSHPLTTEIYIEQAELRSRRGKLDELDHSLRKDFSKRRLIPRNDGLAFAPDKKLVDHAFRKFSLEWNSSLEIMRGIGRRVVSEQIRPGWIDNTVPMGVQADQFLHAYYYKVVKLGNQHPFEEFHLRNASDPEAALVEAMEWWRRADFDYRFERRTIYDWAPEIRNAFSRDRILSLSKAEFVSAFSKIHAVRDYANKQENEHLGLPSAPQKSDDKVFAYSSAMWSQVNNEGKSVLQVLERAIWGAGPVAERLWEGVRSAKWSFPRIRLSTLGEILGWARPDDYPPRNLRTSKGLRALGFKVRV